MNGDVLSNFIPVIFIDPRAPLHIPLTFLCPTNFAKFFRMVQKMVVKGNKYRVEAGARTYDVSLDTRPVATL